MYQLTVKLQLNMSCNFLSKLIACYLIMDKKTAVPQRVGGNRKH